MRKKITSELRSRPISNNFISTFHGGFNIESNLKEHHEVHDQ